MAIAKSCRIAAQFCSFSLANQLRLIFDYHALNGAMLNRARVINTNFLAGSQRGRHHFAGRVNNVRSRAKRETHRALLAPDDDRLARFIGSYSACLVSCACSGFRCGCGSVRCGCFFSRGRAGLCKRQRRNQPADQSNNCLLHSDASSLIRFNPKFVTRGSSGRFGSVLYFDGAANALFELVCHFGDLSDRREFGNMGRQ